jgi:hypothetical protein
MECIDRQSNVPIIKYILIAIVEEEPAASPILAATNKVILAYCDLIKNSSTTI